MQNYKNNAKVFVVAENKKSKKCQIVFILLLKNAIFAKVKITGII